MPIFLACFPSNFGRDKSLPVVVLKLTWLPSPSPSPVLYRSHNFQRRWMGSSQSSSSSPAPTPSPNKTNGMSSSYIVQYCANWDGGEQEREAATKAIKEADPGAVVSARKLDSYPVQVTIFKEGPGGEEKLFNCAQRELFSKNGWPAKPKIIQAIKSSL